MVTAVPPADMPDAKGTWYRRRVARKHGLSGEVYSMIPLRGGRKTVEVPRALLPSSSPFLAYDISLIPDGSADDANDGSGEFVLNAVRPMEVHRRGSYMENGVRKRNRVKVDTITRIPAAHKRERREVAPALIGNDEFYELLVHYDSDVLKDLKPRVWKRMAEVARAHSEAVGLWPALCGAAGVTDQAPEHPDLESRDRVNSPALRLYREIRAMYEESGMVNFRSLAALGETEAVAQLQEWNVLTKELTFTNVARLEQLVLQEVAPKATVHHFESWHDDFYSFAQGQTVVLCADAQTLVDAKACGVAGAFHWTDALGGGLGSKFVLLRAERMTLSSMVELAGVCDELVLCGDTEQRLAFRERHPMHALPLLVNHLGGIVDHPWPSHTWQSAVADDIANGTTRKVEVLALTTWQRLSKVVSASELKRSIILCATEDVRRSAMNALSTPASPVTDVPRKGAVFAHHKTGNIGPVQEVGHRHSRLLDHQVKNKELRRGDIEVFTKFLGTRRETVVCIIDANTPRVALLSALKYAEKKFKVLIAPGTRASLAKLQDGYDYPVTLSAV